MIINDVYLINIGLLFDVLSSSMIVVVTTISTLVIYILLLICHMTRIYLDYDLFIVIYFFYVSISNIWYFLQLFVGWEGVGLCSYLLINFWFTRILANKAALKAMIMNRIADVFFIIAI